MPWTGDKIEDIKNWKCIDGYQVANDRKSFEPYEEDLEF